MLPTPFADALIEDVRATLAAADKALNRRLTFEPGSASREFSICCTDITEIVLVPALIDHLHREAPGVSVTLSRISGATPEEFAAGSVALAVGFVSILEAGFYQQTLFDQDFVCLAAKDHPRIGNRLTTAAMSTEGYVSVITSGTGHAIVDRVLEQHKIKRRVAVRTSTYLAVGSIVARTELLVIVPRHLGEALAAREKVKILEPPIMLPKYAVKQYWHQRYHTDPANVWLRHTVAEIFCCPSALEINRIH
jgi:DNA-binding transcriptional LysR family regulator